MGIEKPSPGTRGARTPPHVISRLMTPLMVRVHRRSGDRFHGLDLLPIPTVCGLRSPGPDITSRLSS